MIPLTDVSRRPTTFPIVTLTIVAVNVANVTYIPAVLLVGGWFLLRCCLSRACRRFFIWLRVRAIV